MSTIIDAVISNASIDITDVSVRDAEPIKKLSKFAQYYKKDEFYPLDLPSQFTPYNFTSITARKFKGKDIGKMYEAAANEQFGKIIATLGSTLTQDINNLTIYDFNYLMYWHRIKSYPTSPYKVQWVSKYGSEETLILTFKNLPIVHMKLTIDEYLKYSEEGFKIPTVADLIDIQQRNLNPKDTWLAERAQFIEGDFESTIELLNEADMEFFEKIKDFGDKVKHGVDDTIKVKAQKSKEELLEIASKKYPQDDPIILELKADNFEVAEETINIRINAMSFFPNNI